MWKDKGREKEGGVGGGRGRRKAEEGKRMRRGKVNGKWNEENVERQGQRKGGGRGGGGMSEREERRNAPAPSSTATTSEQNERKED